MSLGSYTGSGIAGSSSGALIGFAAKQYTDSDFSVLKNYLFDTALNSFHTLRSLAYSQSVHLRLRQMYFGDGLRVEPEETNTGGFFKYAFSQGIEDSEPDVFAFNKDKKADILNVLWPCSYEYWPRKKLYRVRCMQAFIAWHTRRIDGLTRHADEIRRQQGHWQELLDREVAMARLRAGGQP